jgi:hypothetical protein
LDVVRGGFYESLEVADVTPTSSIGLRADPGSGPLARVVHQSPACFDGTPHKRTCVPVDEGVKLQVLDWGGADKPDTMVLLAGYGDTAHVFDQFAYQFTDYFHVIGITRRGFFSIQPAESGYDVGTRAHDDVEVLKHLYAAVLSDTPAGFWELSEPVEVQRAVEKLIYLILDLAKRSNIPKYPVHQV